MRTLAAKSRSIQARGDSLTSDVSTSMGVDVICMVNTGLTAKSGNGDSGAERSCVLLYRANPAGPWSTSTPDPLEVSKGRRKGELQKTVD